MDSSGTSSVKEPSSFEYFFSTKGDILVVTFKGAMDKDSVEALQRCAEEAPAGEISLAVLNLGGITEVDRIGASEFIRLQKAFRSRPSQVRLCGMSALCKEALESFGAIRPAEFKRSLVEAIQER